ncbi:prepilin peptidase [Candidatus Micrarchaeota archaeon]|nr:prepilin peptidase [Candidatus Micrarchaeota archaeon]
MLSYILPSGMNYELLRVLIALVGTGVLTYFDIFKNRNVPDKLLYGFLLISLLFLVIDPQTIIPSVFWGGVIGAIGYLLYRAGQIGGADVILFVTLSFLLPTTPSLFTQQTIQMPFILSLIIVSGMFLILYIIIKYAPKLFAMAMSGRIKFSLDRLFYSGALLFMYVVMIYLLYDMGMGNPLPFVLLLGYLVFITIFVNLFKTELTQLMSEKVDLSKKSDRTKITEEDVVALELMDKDYVKKHNIPKLLTTDAIKRLSKEKVKLIVLTKLPPFIPFVFLSLILEILFGDPLYYIISGMFLPYYF